MRRLIVKIHLIIALVGGVFMVVLGLTGSVIAFEPELDRLLHSDISYVKPGGRGLSLAEIGAAVSRKYPSEPIVAYLPSQSPDVATEVILSRGIVAVNPYSGEVLGLRTRGQTFLGFMRALHIRLATGVLGRGIVKWSSVTLLFSMVSGLYLWWPRKATRIRGRRWTTLFWWDLHNVIGVFSLIPLLVLTATGIVIGFENQFGYLLDALGGTSRIDPVRVNVVQPAVRGDEITPDQALAVVTTKFPGIAVHRVQMPEFGGLYRVSFAKLGRYIIRGEDSVSIDPHSAEIVQENLFRNAALRERFMIVNGAIHTGSILGMTTRIAAAAVSLSIPVQAVSGLLLWLRRRKRTSGARS